MAPKWIPKKVQYQIDPPDADDKAAAAAAEYFTAAVAAKRKKLDADAASSAAASSAACTLISGDSVLPDTHDDENGAPTTKRDTREKKETAPPTDGRSRGQATPACNEGANIGNTGWFFGNWGAIAEKQKAMLKHTEGVLKRQPAMIIGLAEASKRTEDMLRGPTSAVAVDTYQDPEVDAFFQRDGYEYLTLRGREPKSLLLAVRKRNGCDLELLHWERRFEGTYKARTRGVKRNTNAYSRCLIARITLDNNVGFIGKEHVVLVMHLNNHFANEHLGKQKLARYWDWLAETIKDFSVKVIMGDFNMSFFRVVPELRSRGVQVDLAAWYPWKTDDGEPMADSCGIFFVDAPGIYELKVNMSHLHDRGLEGFFAVAEEKDVGASEDRTIDPYDRILKNAGPGQELKTYLPKGESYLDKIRPTLTPSAGSLRCTVANMGKHMDAKPAGPKTSAGEARSCIQVREKRLNANIWMLNLENHRGSHFPLCVFTNNVGRRSAEALRHRSRAGNDRRAEKEKNAAAAASSNEWAGGASVNAWAQGAWTDSRSRGYQDDAWWSNSNASWRDRNQSWQPDQW